MPFWGRRTTLSVDHGAYVASVVQHGAALAAAILVGDLIVQIDNTPVTDPQSLGLAMRWRNIVVGSQQMRFWLEWDRGTMNVRDLAVKFTSYASYIASREWARERSMLPVLVCVAPDIAQERRMQRVAQARLTSPPGLVVWTTTRVLLDEQGPLAPIWLQRRPQSSQAAQSGSALRQCLFDVIPGESRSVCLGTRIPRSRHINVVRGRGTSHAMVPARYAPAPVVASLSVQEMSIVHDLLSSQRKMYLDCQPEEQIRTEIYERSRPRRIPVTQNVSLDTSVSSYYHITN